MDFLKNIFHHPIIILVRSGWNFQIWTKFNQGLAGKIMFFGVVGGSAKHAGC